MVKKEELVEFEKYIGDLFNAGKIKAPIHLYSGNEDQIIKVFKNIDIENDWVCCTWRNHYQALLKGIPKEVITERILDGKSMVMNLPEYKFICSSIVGGIPSIATGIAWSLKLQNKKGRVWVWTGDMSTETGHWHEAYKFAQGHDLPIIFVVEDNQKSVCTPTNKIWGRDIPYYLDKEPTEDIVYQPHLIYYKYNNEKYPHAGAGQRVQF
jgi:TPP-dependent pyruvate/acetoin dehydrogenase alpha subunit